MRFDRSSLAERTSLVLALIEPGAIHTGFNQAMIARKYAWMERSSYFKEHLAQIKARENRIFAKLEARSTASIVAKIVAAAEAPRGAELGLAELDEARDGGLAAREVVDLGGVGLRAPQEQRLHGRQRRAAQVPR